MARLKEIEVSLGITVEQKGIYYKPNARMVVELDNLDTPAKREQIWNKAWDTVSTEVQKQLKEILE